MARKPIVSTFEEALYPHQPLRNLVAILTLVAAHLLLAYLLLYKNMELPIKQGGERSELIMLDLPTLVEPETTTPQPEKIQPKRKQRKARPADIKSALRSPPIQKPTDITSQIAAARERRQALEEEAVKQNREAQVVNKTPTEDEVVMARIKANIKSAMHSRKGKNGIFQVTSKGVQTGRFTFRGWNNDPNQSTWQSYEVDAGVGGDVELALIRRMIALIREHYSGDFNWESQRLGRMVVLSARPADNAQLESFLRKEFFER